MNEKHIAIRSKSIRRDMNYTTPGLGDRSHCMLLAYQYSTEYNVPVKIHLTSDKHGKQHKKTSWKELSEMVPVKYQVHDVCGLSEDGWLDYLTSKGIDAEIYYYKDTQHMHPMETTVPLEISQYLKKLVNVDPLPVGKDLNLPKKYVTQQWDSTDAGRNISPILLLTIQQKYESMGYELITIGGASKNKLLKDSLKHIGYAIANADFHIGGDSGMMHIAQLYKQYEDIHIYNNDGYKSHHFIRAVRNGSPLNLYLN